MATDLAQRIDSPAVVTIERSLLSAEVVARPETFGTWGVEAINDVGDGEIYMAVFSGPDARALAEEYARAKYESVIVR